MRRSTPTDCRSPPPASAIVPAASAELAQGTPAREPHPNAASPEILRPAARVGVKPEDCTLDSGDTRLQLCPVRSSRGDLVMLLRWTNRGFVSGLYERMGGLGSMSLGRPKEMKRMVGIVEYFSHRRVLLEGAFVGANYER